MQDAVAEITNRENDEMICVLLLFFLMSDQEIVQTLAKHRTAGGRVRSFSVQVSTSVTVNGKTVQKAQLQQYLFGSQSYLNQNDEAISDNVILSNRRYAAVLKKNINGYTLEKLVEGNEKEKFDELHSTKFRNQVKNHLDIHLIGTISADNLLKSDLFRCTTTRRNDDLVIDYKRIDKDKNEPNRMLDGVAILSYLPPLHCKEYKFSKRLQSKVYLFTQQLSVIEADGEFYPLRRLQTIEHDNGRSEYSLDYRDFHNTDLPESRFRLSYYGLPEPVTEQQSETSDNRSDSSFLGKASLIIILSIILVFVLYFFKIKRSRNHA